MASFNLEQTARARLAATKGVAVLDDALPHHPEVVTVLAGLRVLHVTADGDVFNAQAHLRLGQWMPLADDVSEDVAFAAVLDFLRAVASVPQDYRPEHDAAEVSAARAVYADHTAPLSRRAAA